ncbi:MAG TPA: GNAT family N-acyltransferase [Candidatus Saccharimonadales bacterium]|nr:GNAT family N-acyltransferase [Candidatus Saccharimonadales bacterium]
MRTIEEAAELDACQRLRAAVFAHEKGWIPADALIGGREVDRYDDVALHGGVFDFMGELVGTFRMIFSTIPLPIQDLYGIVPDPKRRSVELSRLAVRPEFRASAIMLGLCRWIFAEAVEHQVADMYAIMERPLLRNLIKLGFPFESLGEEREIYRGSFDRPTVLRTAEIIPGLSRKDLTRRLKIAPFFTSPFDGLLSGDVLRPPKVAQLQTTEQEIVNDALL